MPKMPKMTTMKKKNDRSPQKTTTSTMEEIEKNDEEEGIRESASTLPTDQKELGEVLHAPEDRLEVHQDPEASGRPSKAPERAGDNSPKKTLPGGYILQANQPGTLSQLLQDPEAGGEVLQDPEAIRRLTMTPERAWSNQIKKRLFTIGRDTNKEDVYVGKVIQAKMTIEERMKKEMRDKKLEEVRRRVIQTPKNKRDRREDGLWDEATTELGKTPDSSHRSQEGSRSNRKLQTPLTSFLIHQTPAQRRAAIQKRSSSNFQKEADSRMSSSPGSPALRRSKGMRTGARKGAEDKGKEVQKTGKVSSIRNFFEFQAKTSPTRSEEQAGYNNNTGFIPLCTTMCSRGDNKTQRGSQTGSHIEERISSE